MSHHINTAELGNMLIGAYVGELINMHEKNQSTIEESVYPTVSSDLEVSFATTESFNIGSIKALIPSDCMELNPFIRENINMSELVKTTLSYDQLNNFLLQLKKTDALDIYGMIINLGKDARINPLHPFIAQAIASGRITLPETFEVVIYPMSKKQKISSKGLETNVTAAVELLNFVNQKGQTVKESVKPSNSSYSDIRSFLASANPLTFPVEFTTNESSTMRNVMTPVQFASDGVITPYYGVIESQFEGGSYRSRQLSPMLSGNINTNNTSYGNTCTGDLSNSYYSSLRVLNGFNMSSAYFQSTVSKASFHWIKACQLISIELLTSNESEPTHVEEAEEKTKEEGETNV
jgi:hypothetical protein